MRNQAIPLRKFPLTLDETRRLALFQATSAAPIRCLECYQCLHVAADRLFCSCGYETAEVPAAIADGIQLLLVEDWRCITYG